MVPWQAGAGGSDPQFRPPLHHRPRPDWVLSHDANGSGLLRGASVVVKHDAVEAVSAGPVPGGDRRIRPPGQILLPGLLAAIRMLAAPAPRRASSKAASFARPSELIEIAHG